MGHSKKLLDIHVIALEKFEVHYKKRKYSLVPKPPTLLER